MAHRITSTQENTAVSVATLEVIKRLDTIAVDDKDLRREIAALRQSLGLEKPRILELPSLKLASATNQLNESFTNQLTPSAILGKMRSLSTSNNTHRSQVGEASPSQSVDQLIAKRKQELEEIRRQSK